MYIFKQPLNKNKQIKTNSLDDFFYSITFSKLVHGIFVMIQYIYIHVSVSYLKRLRGLWGW